MKAVYLGLVSCIVALLLGCGNQPAIPPTGLKAPTQTGASSRQITDLEVINVTASVSQRPRPGDEKRSLINVTYSFSLKGTEKIQPDVRVRIQRLVDGRPVVYFDQMLKPTTTNDITFNGEIKDSPSAILRKEMQLEIGVIPTNARDKIVKSAVPIIVESTK